MNRSWHSKIPASGENPPARDGSHGAQWMWADCKGGEYIGLGGIRTILHQIIFPRLASPPLRFFTLQPLKLVPLHLVLIRQPKPRKIHKRRAPSFKCRSLGRDLNSKLGLQSLDSGRLDEARSRRAGGIDIVALLELDSPTGWRRFDPGGRGLVVITRRQHGKSVGNKMGSVGLGWDWAKGPRSRGVAKKKIHGSLARAGKVKSQTPKVEKQEKKKTPKGRAKKRLLYTRRFVNVTTLPGGKRRM
ncbi:ribosomal protein S30 [Rhizoctonia solani]|uniref:Ribosomal protein S30 n=1 Tax=Rhizoctonia solani TaxID=456999 RepID=A0A8H7M138_9AGAM|nr:ribosomal protein S30 [Rhizoctonia solani]